MVNQADNSSSFLAQTFIEHAHPKRLEAVTYQVAKDENGFMGNQNLGMESSISMREQDRDS